MRKDIRQYQSIWNKLKQNKSASIAAPSVLHRRIIKAVQKEKNMDLGYKLQLEPRHAILFNSKNNSIITFYLKISLCEEDF